MGALLIGILSIGGNILNVILGIRKMNVFNYEVEPVVWKSPCVGFPMAQMLGGKF